MSKQKDIMNALTDKKLKESGAAGLGTVLGILFDKEQKLRGNDTPSGTMNIFNIVNNINQLQRASENHPIIDVTPSKPVDNLFKTPAENVDK